MSAIGIDIKKYFSQFDGDNGGYTGTCVETCLKMVDCYLTGKEIAIKDIVKNGDNDPSFTTIAGAEKAAKFLGFPIIAKNGFNNASVRNALKVGHLIIAIIEYGKLPALYKQDQNYKGGHAVLITGISDDNSIRYADPNFRGADRDKGFMNNNKWASNGDFMKAWGPYNTLGFEVNKTKAVPAPVTPKPDPKDKEIETLKDEIKKLNQQIKNINDGNNDLLNDIFSTPNKAYVPGKPQKAGWQYRTNTQDELIKEYIKKEATHATEIAKRDETIKDLNNKLVGENERFIELVKSYDKEVESKNKYKAEYQKIDKAYEDCKNEIKELRSELVTCESELAKENKADENFILSILRKIGLIK